MCVRGKSLSLAPISLGATLSSGDTFPATPFFMRIREKIFKILFLLCAAFSIIASFIICLFLFMNGIPAIQKIGFIDFIFGLKWKPGNDLYGIFPMIAGSLYVTAGAIIFGVPVGLMTAIFLSKFCPKKLHELLKPAIDLLAGIPSVVYGFFGLMVIVPFVRNVFGGNGSSILTASLLLGMMILPTIICVSETSLNSVPQNYYEGAPLTEMVHAYIEKGLANELIEYFSITKTISAAKEKIISEAKKYPEAKFEELPIYIKSNS